MQENEIIVPEGLYSAGLRSYPEEQLLERLVNLEPTEDGLQEFEPLTTFEEFGSE